MAAVTCRTEGCGNADIPIELTLVWTDEGGQEHSIDQVTCGVCGQPITDIREDTPDA